MTQLLVSVRSAEEAAQALAGGADVIDVKEPRHGSLGMAEASVIQAVVDEVAGSRPISAALGELLDLEGKNRSADVDLSTLRFLKVGLAGCRSQDPSEIGKRIHRLARDVTKGTAQPRWVAVAYADSQRAEAPSPEQIAEMACSDRQFWGAFLIDTWKKDGSTLLDWLSLEAIDRFCRELRAVGLPIALAGSLGHEEIRKLLPLEPHLIAVRGAACSGRDRNAHVDREAVQGLAALLRNAEQPHARPTHPRSIR